MYIVYNVLFLCNVYVYVYMYIYTYVDCVPCEYCIRTSCTMYMLYAMNTMCIICTTHICVAWNRGVREAQRPMPLAYT